MDLLEYQVKEWFEKIGIPVLPNQRIEHPTDLKRLKIRYPIVLKSQVYGSDRAKVGGVRFAETTIDAIAAAQNIFNLPICGQLPEILLAEAKYDNQAEYYLAVVLDTALCRPVLLGCNEADIDWEEAGEKMHYVIVKQDFSPFYARRLALKMGLQGALMRSISHVIEKMYQLFVEKDLDLVEINPLSVNSAGQVMALNGNVSINERAIARHTDIALIARKIIHHQASRKTPDLGDGDGINLPGKIGILGNGAGSVMTTLDLIVNAGGQPGVCLNLRHAFLTDTSPTTFASRLDKALKILAEDKSIEVILINFLGSLPQASEVSDVISGFLTQITDELKPHPSGNGNHPLKPVFNKYPHLVLRLAGSEFDSIKKHLTSFNSKNSHFVLDESLDAAVDRAVSLAKGNNTP